MKINLHALLYCLLVGFLMNSCSSKPEPPQEQPLPIQPESHSFARPDQAIVKHLFWQAEVDFKNKQIIATATWEIENTAKGNRIIFDTRDMHIDSITLDNSPQAVAYEWITSKQTFMGTGLSVHITPETHFVHIYYITSPDAAALQWLNPEQTADKKQAFLFTQSEAILARSWIPCQDAPAVRFTYDAKVKVPSNLLALMSAGNNPLAKNDSGCYVFQQGKPIPSYLMALAVGDLAYKKVDERCGVYTEINELNAVAWEFADMGKMVTAAEELYGPYAWGRYDVLVLPPSFPFGGMENPCLTFATPTVVTGNRDLVTLVAHELAHSWSGNLITNANWDDFWLNEGFTVYFEQRIMEALNGADYAEMLAAINERDLKIALTDFGDTSADTRLKLNLLNRDPDDGMTDIAYDKGYFFLRLLEEKAGRKKWDQFLKSYFAKYKFQSMTTERFIAFLQTELIQKDSVKFKDLALTDWVYKPGVPANKPKLSYKRFQLVDSFALHYLMVQKLKDTPADTAITGKWTTHEWIRFLNDIQATVTTKQMAYLDQQFHFTGAPNCEIADLWYLLAIQKNYDKAYPAMEQFLTRVGRRKFLSPLYKELSKTASGKQLAVKIYAKARANYHSVSQTTIDEMLN